MRTCCECKQTSEQVDFYHHTHGRCKKCHKETTRMWYHNNREAAVKKRTDKRKAQAKWVQQYKTDRACADCNQKYHFAAMHFDHLPQFEKHQNISVLLGKGLDLIKAEIEKCELVCANCHAVRTYERALKAGTVYV